MKALILAAGQGTRLAPLTDDRPKCLVELAGSSLLERQVETLNGKDIRDITVLTGYRGDQVAAKGYATIANPEFSESNMVHTLFSARPLMTPGTDLIISYGDIVYEPRVLQALLDCDAPMAVAVDQEWRQFWEIRMDDPLSDAETLKLDGEGRILELGKKPLGYQDIQGQYMGLIKVSATHVGELLDLYDSLDPKGLYDGRTLKQMYMTSFIQEAINSGWHVQSAPVSNGWLEVDTFAEMQQYQRMYDDGSLSAFCRLGPAQ
jgi:choline kinase